MMKKHPSIKRQAQTMTAAVVVAAFVVV